MTVEKLSHIAKIYTSLARDLGILITQTENVVDLSLWKSF